MEKFLTELKEKEERAQLVGDEDETANLSVQIANVEILQLALPRPNLIGWEFHFFWAMQISKWISEQQ